MVQEQKRKKLHYIGVSMALVVYLTLLILLILSLTKSIKNNQYKERKNYLASIAANSSTIVGERISAIKDLTNALRSYIESEEINQTDTVSFIKTVAGRFDYDGVVIAVVDSDKYISDSDGVKSKIRVDTYFDKNTPQTVMYAINKGPTIDNTIVFCVRERLSDNVYVGDTKLEYCIVMYPYEKIKNVTSAYFKTDANVLIIEQKTGEIIYRNYGAGEFLPGSNAYDKIRMTEHFHGENPEDLIQTAKNRGTLATEARVGDSTVYECFSPIIGTDWIYFMVVPSEDLVSSQVGMIESTSIKFAGIVFLFFLLIFGIISISKIRNVEAKLYDAEHESHVAVKKALEEVEKERNNALMNNEIISSISKLYFAIYRIDIVNNVYDEVSGDSEVHHLTGHWGIASDKLKEICNSFINEEYQTEAKEFFNLSTLGDRLSNSETTEFEYLSNDNNWYQARFIVKKRNDDNKVTQVLYVTREISAIKKKEKEMNKKLRDAKERAEAASQAKSTFLFNMSHEIRTPMNAIVGFSQLLKKESDNPERVEYYQSKIEQSSELMVSLLNNVLDMARIESGKLELNESYDHTGQVISSILEVFESKMKEKNITCEREVHVQNEHILCDVTKAREIFTNIISNAVKYTPEGGKIKVVTQELPSNREGYALMQTTISDTGIGMSEEFLPHIFESFEREKTTTTSGIAGTGLGMSIVKRLVELMDGTIDVTSKLGEGSSFVVTIPHRIAPSSYYETKVERTEASEEKKQSGKHLLMAEDNELNAEIAMAILTDSGYEVDWAADGVICLDMYEKAAEGTYDAILMDIQMPNMDGYKTARAIRHLDSKRKSGIPIIAMTANAFEEDKKNALAAGMNGHVAKPINVEILLKVLEEVLNPLAI